MIDIWLYLHVQLSVHIQVRVMYYIVTIIVVPMSFTLSAIGTEFFLGRPQNGMFVIDMCSWQTDLCEF